MRTLAEWAGWDGIAAPGLTRFKKVAFLSMIDHWRHVDAGSLARSIPSTAAGAAVLPAILSERPLFRARHRHLCGRPALLHLRLGADLDAAPRRSHNASHSGLAPWRG